MADFLQSPTFGIDNAIPPIPQLSRSGHCGYHKWPFHERQLSRSLYNSFQRYHVCPLITVNSIVLTLNTFRYAYATNSNARNIPVATSIDGGASWNLTAHDALENVGAWAYVGSTWAPDVIRRSDGTLVLCE